MSDNTARWQTVVKSGGEGLAGLKAIPRSHLIAANDAKNPGNPVMRTNRNRRRDSVEQGLDPAFLAHETRAVKKARDTWSAREEEARRDAYNPNFERPR
ncbi:MAG: hypothetical protein V4735_02460 [Pseudomonadota bacterium]